MHVDDFSQWMTLEVLIAKRMLRLRNPVLIWLLYQMLLQPLNQVKYHRLAKRAVCRHLLELLLRMAMLPKTSQDHLCLGTFGVVDCTNSDDMKFAIRKLDDTEFRNPWTKTYVEVISLLLIFISSFNYSDI